MLGLVSLAQAATITVGKSGAEDFSNIQAAIDSAVDGDYVLVYPARYFETIIIEDKAISVCSLEDLTGYTGDIDSTIIDGNRQGSTVRFGSSSQYSTLRGFTITGGSGTMITNSYCGGGVLANAGSRAHLTNCVITGNQADLGGGLYSHLSQLELNGVTVTDNFAFGQTGGVWHEAVLPQYPVSYDPVNRCSIFNNYSLPPMDLMLKDINNDLEVKVERFTVSDVNAYYYLYDYSQIWGPQFQVLLNIRSAALEPVCHDLWVSPAGNDQNSGLSPDAPLQNIRTALHRIRSDTGDLYCVRLLEGEYRLSEQLQPIVPKHAVSIIGAGTQRTNLIIDEVSNPALPGFIIPYPYQNAELEALRFSAETGQAAMAICCYGTHCSLTLRDVAIEDLKCHQEGVIRLSSPSSLNADKLLLRNLSSENSILNVEYSGYMMLSNCVFENLVHDADAPPQIIKPLIRLGSSEFIRLRNNIFRGLDPGQDQLALEIGYPYYSPLYGKIVNCLFSDISAGTDYPIMILADIDQPLEIFNNDFIDIDGAAAVYVQGNQLWRNNIMHDPADREIYVPGPSVIISVPPTSLDLDYCLLPQGVNSIEVASDTSGLTEFSYGENNISGLPGFLSLDPYSSQYLVPYPGSLMVDHGSQDADSLDTGSYDLAGNVRIWDGRVDIGALESGSIPYAPNAPVTTDGNRLYNYPNPFTQASRVVFNLDKTNPTELSIYNLRGQLVRQIDLGIQIKGAHSYLWDGEDSHGRQVATGIYLLRLKTGEATLTRKLTLKQ